MTDRTITLIMAAFGLVVLAVLLCFGDGYLIVLLYGVNGWLGTAALLLFVAVVCYVLEGLLAAAEIVDMSRDDDDADQTGDN